MTDDDQPGSQQTGTTKHRARVWGAAEVLLILLLFFIWAGWPTPDVNEAHYLAKAKHYWNPAWCQGDHFLESADAHLLFYWSVGWLTLLLPLPAVAWLGRILTWSLLAWAWRRMSFALVRRPLAAVFSAALFLVLSQYGHMAGEWMVGGLEAKGFAFFFVLLALEALIKRRWRIAWMLLGAATAFHVLVGGWTIVATGIAWLVAGKDRSPLTSMLPACAVAVVLALPGLVPGIALSWGVDGAIVRQANIIYVFERLSHHLVLHRLPLPFVLRHVALLAAWLTLVWLNRRWLLSHHPSSRRLDAVVLGAVIVAAAGALLDLLWLTNETLAAAVLRYYWFRLSDVMLPLGTALGLVVWLDAMDRPRPTTARWCLLATMSLTLLLVGVTVFRRQADPRSGAAIQSLPALAHDPQQTHAIYDDWRCVCRWVAKHTEPDARLLTPRMQQTFKWHAGRSEIVTWKDVPQDARGIVQWWNRYREVYPPYLAQRGTWEPGLAAHSDTELVVLARKYDADYLLIDRTRFSRPLGLARIYPNHSEQNGSYEVYRVPQEGDRSLSTRE